jgi:hypothetical protein
MGEKPRVAKNMSLLPPPSYFPLNPVDPSNHADDCERRAGAQGASGRDATDGRTICQPGEMAQIADLAQTRRGTPCQSPVVAGKPRCRMHGGAPGSGAPKGRRNGKYRHGGFTTEAIDERRRLASLIRDSRDFLSRLAHLHENSFSPDDADDRVGYEVVNRSFHELIHLGLELQASV